MKLSPGKRGLRLKKFFLRIFFSPVFLIDSTKVHSRLQGDLLHASPYEASFTVLALMLCCRGQLTLAVNGDTCLPESTERRMQ